MYDCSFKYTFLPYRSLKIRFGLTDVPKRFPPTANIGPSGSGDYIKKMTK